MPPSIENNVAFSAQSLPAMEQSASADAAHAKLDAQETPPPAPLSSSELSYLRLQRGLPAFPNRPSLEITDAVLEKAYSPPSDYHPYRRVHDEDFRATQRSLRQATAEDQTKKTALARMGGSRDWLLYQRVWPDYPNAPFDEIRDAMRLAAGFTLFGERPLELAFLRKKIISELEAKNEHIRIAVIDPGFAGFRLGHPKKGRQIHATYSPYLLAALSPKAQVAVYSLAPEPGEVVRNSQGSMYLAPVGALIDAASFYSEWAKRFEDQFGSEWRNYFAELQLIFQEYCKACGLEAVHSQHVIPMDGMPVGAMQMQFPKEIVNRVLPPDRTVDVSVDPIPDNELDLVIYHGTKKDHRNGHYPSQVMALIRIVSRLKEGAYLVIGQTDMLPPALAKILGLELMVDGKGSQFGNTPSLVFAKRGSPLEWVHETSQRIEKTLEAARAFSVLSPYRFPAYHENNAYASDRFMPSTPANQVAATNVWEEELSEANLARITQQEENLNDVQVTRRAVQRLNEGPDGNFHTLTFFNSDPELYQELAKALAANFEPETPLYAASFGAGYIPFSSTELSVYHVILSKIARRHELQLQGMIAEPIEILLHLLSRFLNSQLLVLDRDRRVQEFLSRPRGLVLWPAFTGRGYTYDSAANEEFEAAIKPSRESMNRLLQTAGAGPQSRLEWKAPADFFWHSWFQREQESSYQAHYFEVPEEHWRKLTAYRTDFATKLLPAEMEKLHFAFYRQVAYFLHPVLQKAAFIKIVHQLRNEGILISDYLLTHAEAALLGLEMDEPFPPKNQKGWRPIDHRDRHYYIYGKREETPFVRERMEAIRKVQEFQPSVSGEGQDFKGLAEWEQPGDAVAPKSGNLHVLKPHSNEGMLAPVIKPRHAHSHTHEGRGKFRRNPRRSRKAHAPLRISTHARQVQASIPNSFCAGRGLQLSLWSLRPSLSALPKIAVSIGR